MGGFFSFLQITTRTNALRSASYVMRVQGGQRVDRSYQLTTAYAELIKQFGQSINILHALERDQLIAPVHTVKTLLRQVPLTIAGYRFMQACESNNPTIPV